MVKTEIYLKEDIEGLSNPVVMDNDDWSITSNFINVSNKGETNQVYIPISNIDKVIEIGSSEKEMQDTDEKDEESEEEEEELETQKAKRKGILSGMFR